MGRYVLGESKEDYLETILVVQNLQGYCRSIDVASALGFTKASVSIAVKKLIENKDIIKKANGELVLTEQGYEIASKTYERHTFFTDLLMTAGVNKNTAENDACLLEHIVSDETYQCMKKWFLAKKNA